MGERLKRASSCQSVKIHMGMETVRAGMRAGRLAKEATLGEI